MKRNIASWLSVLLVSVWAGGCSKEEWGGFVNDPKRPEAAAVGCVPIPYGDNVVYIPCVGSQFGRALEKFTAENAAKMEVAAMAGDSRGGYGRDEGYWVVMKKRQQETAR